MLQWDGTFTKLFVHLSSISQVDVEKYAISSFIPHELRTQDMSILIKTLRAERSASIEF